MSATLEHAVLAIITLVAGPLMLVIYRQIVNRIEMLESRVQWLEQHRRNGEN